MMIANLHIKSVFRDYTVNFCTSYSASLKELARPGDHIFVDKGFLDLYSFPTLENGVVVTSIEASEEMKSYQAATQYFNQLIEGGFRRDNQLIAVGGGIIQDIVAFVASLLYRGVDWIFFPTNMLTQCDSCIGSKTSINFKQYKNQLGGFYPPAGVYIDTSLTETLAIKDRCSGLGEMLHYFLVTSDADLDLFWTHAPRVLSKQGSLAPLMRRSLEIKKAMIEIDEFDRGPRNVFNYGHSFGHALESATRYSIPHGVAVAYGIDLANVVAVKMGIMPVQERNKIRPACELVFGEFPLPELNHEQYLSALKKDKKNERGKFGWILGEAIGRMNKILVEPTPEILKEIARFYDEKIYLKSL